MDIVFLDVQERSSVRLKGKEGYLPFQVDLAFDLRRIEEGRMLKSPRR